MKITFETTDCFKTIKLPLSSRQQSYRYCNQCSHNRGESLSLIVRSLSSNSSLKLYPAWYNLFPHFPIYNQSAKINNADRIVMPFWSVCKHFLDLSIDYYISTLRRVHLLYDRLLVESRSQYCFCLTYDNALKQVLHCFSIANCF